MIPPEAEPFNAVVRTETERRRAEGPFPAYRLELWERAFPGLVAGLTEAAPESDFAASRTDAWTFLERVERLGEQLGFASAAWARQVHGVEVERADEAPRGAFTSPGEADGLVARCGGPLLVVTVADCVPVYLLDSERRALALLHAGWRGAAAGILERGVAMLEEAYASEPAKLHLHLGPSICCACYEVGEEVLAALGREPPLRGGVDLREELARQGLGLGISHARISRSTWCTSCDRDRFHSHRGSQGAAGRMAAFFGWREA